MSNIKVNQMSKNIIKTMKSLSYNNSISRLLINELPDPYGRDLPSDFKSSSLVKQNSQYCRILPVPFDPDAKENDSVFVRVYYNDGKIDGEIISENILLIDIVCAKSLWLIKGIDGNESIRPYDIMENVIDAVGRRSGNPDITIPFTAFRHLSVNTKFDAIRLYSEEFQPME